MKKILFNVTPEETRMVMIEDGRLTEMEAERPDHSHLVGNIYKGRVQNVLPGMQAAFVDIGQKKNAFLYLGDGSSSDGRRAGGGEKLSVGRPVTVQVIKDAVGTKGPRVTTQISLPGRNIVLMPTADYIGMSRRIADEEERSRLHGIAQEICPEGMGLIIRTLAVGQDRETLAADVQYLLKLWESLCARNRVLAAPALLYRDADMAIRVVRDLMTEEVEQLIVDDADTYRRVGALVKCLSPALETRVELYEGRVPLFREYGVAEEAETLTDREVELPSGGFLVIDRTEALTVIDVNTGKFVGDSNLSDTVYQANMEAAEEILRQLRLRDIGGIIVVDFIDMDTEEQKEGLLSFLRERAKWDRTKTNIIGLTALGLVEITRKKSRQNLDSLLYSECPCCHGSGRVESPETVAIRICRDIRRIEERSHADFGYEVEVHETVAYALMDSPLVERLSSELGVKVSFVIKPGMQPESYAILQRGNGR